jgi:hypothetical protein
MAPSGLYKKFDDDGVYDVVDYIVFVEEVTCIVLSTCCIYIHMRFEAIQKIRLFLLVFWLQVSSLARSALTFMSLSPSIYNSDVCTAQAFLSEVFVIASECWVLCISVYMYIGIVVRGINGVQQHSLLVRLSNNDRFVHIIVWPVAVIMASLPMITKSYGPASFVCGWVDLYAGIYYFYVFLLVAFLVNSVVLFKTHMELRLMASIVSRGDSPLLFLMLNGIMRTFKLYPAVFIAVWGVSLFYRFAGLLYPSIHDNRLAASLFYSIRGTSMNSLASAVVFLCTPFVQRVCRRAVAAAWAKAGLAPLYSSSADDGAPPLEMPGLEGQVLTAEEQVEYEALGEEIGVYSSRGSSFYSTRTSSVLLVVVASSNTTVV